MLAETLGLPDFIRRFVGYGALFVLWTAMCVACISYAIYKESYFLLVLPFFIPLVQWIVRDYRNLYYLFFLLLPISIEYEFSNGFGTDLPTEPVMLLLTGLSILLVLHRLNKLDLRVLYQPITILLLLHLLWIATTTILSGDQFISFKYMLAKLWYIIPFYFLTVHIIHDSMQVRKVAMMGACTCFVIMVYVLVRHAAEGFSFESCSRVVSPLRNHVNYASSLVVFLPYFWALYAWEKRPVFRKIFAFLIVLTVVAISFSYTRAAILSIIIAVGAYFVMRMKWVRPTLGIALISLLIMILYFSYNNNYLEFRPDYQRTIMHEEFGNLIEATYNLEDISTMERVYRWVAGAEMISDKPWTGFGPGCFYTFYKGYTVSSFQTYVSDNPDHSTVHCYYLLVFIEQGLPGFLIFLGLICFVLIMGEKVYHSLKEKNDKIAIVAAFTSFVIVLSINLINDMVETDKVGTFFFLNAGIITVFALKSGVNMSIFERVKPNKPRKNSTHQEN